MPEFDQLISIVRAVSKGEIAADETCTPRGLKVGVQDLVNVCAELHQNASTYFDLLSCVTGIDNGPAANTMEVIYNLYSIPYDNHLTIKVVLPRERPEIETVSHIWKTANWHERETFDLFGIHFKGHPDLRRILLPADWEGFPLRKDYKHQDYYRGIKVEY